MECLTTVSRFSECGIPMRITVIDNCSRRECVDKLESSLPPSVGIIEHTTNRGWGGGFNGCLDSWLKEESEDYVFVSAHDALPRSNCIPQMLEAMAHDSTIGIVSPEYGSPQIPVYSPWRGARLLNGVKRASGMVEAFPFVHGTVMLFRRRCLMGIGLFDERYFAYGDETEISLRANRCGWKTCIAWGAIVENPGSWTPKPLLIYLWTRSSLLMAKDYGGTMSAIVRAGVIVMRSLTLYWGKRDDAGLASPRARWMAVFDYLRGRLGMARESFAELAHSPEVGPEGNRDVH
jgi:GT2 family glycosyltransferase